MLELKPGRNVSPLLLRQIEISEKLMHAYDAVTAALVDVGILAKGNMIHDQISLVIKDEDAERARAILEEVLAGWEITT